jgi:hypothetical protein
LRDGEAEDPVRKRLLGPLALARSKLPVDWATVNWVPVFVTPLAIAPLNSPLALAVVLGPSPTAKLVGLLKQPPPLPTPLIEAQVALAVPAEPNVASAKAPDATAPKSTPPVSLFFWQLNAWFSVSCFRDQVKPCLCSGKPAAVTR